MACRRFVVPRWIVVLTGLWAGCSHNAESDRTAKAKTSEAGAVKATSSPIRNFENLPDSLAPEAREYWKKQNQYRAQRDWKRASVALVQMYRTEPQNIELAEFAAHGIGYDLAIDFESEAVRYTLSQRAIGVLLQAIEASPAEALAYWNVGWYCGQKIGRVDEHREHRRRFATDEDLHRQLSKFVDLDQAKGPDGKPDNWLVAGLYFDKSKDFVRNGSDLRGKSELLLFADATKARISFATAIQDEGHSGETVQLAWRRAEQELHELAHAKLKTEALGEIQLEEYSTLRELGNTKWQAVEKLRPALREQVRRDALLGLSDELRRALEDSASESVEQYELKMDAQKKVEEYVNAALDKIMADPRELELARLITEARAAEKRGTWIDRYRTLVNLDFWLERCQFEQLPIVVDSRQLLFAADQLLAGANVQQEGAQSPQQLYDRAFAQLATILTPDSSFLKNDLILESLQESLELYHRSILRGAPFPDDFPLIEVWRYCESLRKVSSVGP